ncbi:MAG: hypothetical protein ACR2N7_01450 [Acidimicrobiia bacterium]
MNGRAISLTIVAFLIGAFAAGGIGVRVIEEVRTDENDTSLPPSATATAHAMDIAFTLSETNPVVEFHPGHVAELLSVAPLDGETVVTVAVVDAADDARFVIGGAGPGWLSVREVPGTTSYELVWGAADLPSNLQLVALGTVLVPAA